MKALEQLWLRLFRRRRPRLWQRWPKTYGGLSAEEVRWVDAIRPLFDERYYLEKHPEVRAGDLSAAAHYVYEGHAKGYDPAPWFSTRGYALTNPDTANSRMPPFVHYALYGRGEGRTIMVTQDVRVPRPTDQAV